MRRFNIIEAQPTHLAALGDLAKSVESLFGPMIGHGFEQVLITNVQRKAAWIAVDAATRLQLYGGMIFDVREAPTYRVSWLAVNAEHRGIGVGKQLLLSALERVEPPARVLVTTFGSDNPGGIPARHLYDSLGFKAGAMAAKGPEGGTRQNFSLQIEG